MLFVKQCLVHNFVAGFNLSCHQPHLEYGGIAPAFALLPGQQKSILCSCLLCGMLMVVGLMLSTPKSCCCIKSVFMLVNIGLHTRAPLGQLLEHKKTQSLLQYT